MALSRITDITPQHIHEIQNIFDEIESVLAPGGGSGLGDPGGNGILVRTALGVTDNVSLVAPAAGLTIANPSGVSGGAGVDPTFALANDLAALEGLSGTGFAKRTGTDAWSVGSLVSGDIPDLSGTYQPLNAKLTAFGGLANAAGWLHNDGSGTFAYSTPSSSDVGLGSVTNNLQLTVANNLSDLANAGTARSNLGVAIGSNVQAWDADLDAIAAIAGTSGLLKKTAANTWSLDTSSYATQAYADALVLGLLDDRGNYDASGNVFPSSGGSGSAGAILKGDLWTISVAGTLGGHLVTAGDVVRALADTPGQTDANWAIGENNFGYVALNQALADGKIYVGNASGIGTAVTPTGDVTISNAGVTAIGALKVTNVMLAGSIDLTAKVTGILPSANGGTGINNAGRTLTINTNSGTLAFPGAATVMTFPGTSATLARTDAANAFTGNQTFAGNVLPAATDTYDLGSSTLLWRKGYLSELDAVLFAQNTVSVIGGWLLVAKDEGTVDEDVDTSETAIDFGTNNIAVNDFIIFRAAGAVEYMQATSLVSGNNWNVTRNVDGSGANAWPQGSVWVNLGYNGTGRIELNANDTPRISILTQGTTYSAQTELLRMGDLNGNWGYSSAKYGFAVGKYASGFSSITVDEDGVVSIKNGTTERIGLSAAGVMTFKDSAGTAKITLDASAGMTLDGKLKMLGASSAIAIGTTPPTSAIVGTGIWLDRTGMYGLASDVQQAIFDAATGRITFGGGLGRIDALGASLLNVQSSTYASGAGFNGLGANTLAFYQSDSAFATSTGWIYGGDTATGGHGGVQIVGRPMSSATSTSAGIIHLLAHGTVSPAGRSVLEITGRTETNSFIAARTVSFTITDYLSTTQYAQITVGGSILTATDSATNAFSDVLTLKHNSTGTAAASFGGSILFNLESSTTDDQNAARIGAIWTTATHASRTSAFVIQTVNSAASLAEVARFAGNGDFTLTGVIKAGSTPTTLTDSAGKILSAALNTTGTPQFARLGLGGAADATAKLSTGNIRIYESTPPNADASTNRGIILNSTLPSGLITESATTDGEVVSYAANTTQVGTRDTTRVGGLLRIDTRPAEQRLVVYGYATGGSVAADRFSVSLQVGNVKIAGSAARGTTEGTNHLDIFDGTAPVGTLANGVSLYSTSGELRVMDSAGNATLLSPHDKDGRWIHDEINFRGRRLRVDMERLVKRLDEMLGGGFIQEFVVS